MPRGSKLLVLTLLAASSLIIMAGAVVAPVLPAMRQHFAGVPNVELLVSLVLTLPALTIAVSAPFIGLLADKCGRSALLLIGLVAFVVSGVSGYFAESLFGILIGRVGLGLAVASIMTSASALLIDYTQGEGRQKVVGYQSATAGLTGLLLPVASGILAGVGWRLPFLLYLAPLVLIVLAAFFVRDHSQKGSAPDAVKAAFPFKTAAKVYALSFVWMIVMYAIPLQMAHHLSSLSIESSAILGWAVGLPSLAAALASLGFSLWAGRYSFEASLSVAFGCMAFGYAIVGIAEQLPSVLIGLATAGLGFGLAMPSLIGWLQSEMPQSLRGRAAGGYTTATFLAQFCATFVYGALLSIVGPSATFTIVALVCLGIGVLVGISSLQRQVMYLATAKR